MLHTIKVFDSAGEIEAIFGLPASKRPNAITLIGSIRAFSDWTTERPGLMSLSQNPQDSGPGKPDNPGLSA